MLLSGVVVLLEAAVRLAGFGTMPLEQAGFDPKPTAFGYFAVCDEKLGFRNRADGRYDNRYGPRGTEAFAKALAPALGQALRRTQPAEAAKQ